MSKILIIGAGHAGTQLAAGLRKQGFQGNVTLVSEETDLPYHKPPLSKTFLNSPEERLQHLRALSFFASQGIELMLGSKATAIVPDDKQVIFSDGTTVAYDRLVLATGTVPVSLNCPGCELDGVFCLRTAVDARTLRQRLQKPTDIVVVGGGFIGLESAAALAKNGHKVTVLELSDSVLGRACSAEVAAKVTSELKDLGVDVQCGVGVETLQGEKGRVRSVLTSKGNSLKAEIVIVGIGAKPLTELAETAGLEIENGIKVDCNMQSSCRDVFAIGDCTAFPQTQVNRVLRLESIQNATEQADHLALFLTGEDPKPYSRLPWFWSDIGRVKLQIAGLRHEANKYMKIERNNGGYAVYHYKDTKLVCVETIDSGGEHMLARQMVSAGYSPNFEISSISDLRQLKNSFSAWKAARNA
tara:strand:- start:1534 stop:2775 length:1242 start_codon:yes stop_codon:yes gene_type:complete